MKISKRIGLHRWLIWIPIIVATLWVLYPFYWALITSLKRPMDVYHWYAIPFLHFRPTLRNWLLELGPRGSVMLHALINSLIISVGATGIAIVLGTMAGYGLARFRFQPWRNENIALLFLLQRFLPPVVLVIPFFLMMRALHLLDNPLSLILANATLTMPFAVLITHGVFKELPQEWEEMALLDGCSSLGAFWHVALPLAIPAIAAAGIICMAFAWNEFLFALLLSYQKAKPVTVIIAGSGGIRIITHALVAIAPPLILILGAQKYIVRGLTLGMVKG